jgi:hypothetical protein
MLHRRNGTETGETVEAQSRNRHQAEMLQHVGQSKSDTEQWNSLTISLRGESSTPDGSLDEMQGDQDDLQDIDQRMRHGLPVVQTIRMLDPELHEYERCFRGERCTVYSGAYPSN